MTASLRFLRLAFLAAVIIFADSVIKTKKPEKFFAISQIYLKRSAKRHCQRSETETEVRDSDGGQT